MSLLQKILHCYVQNLANLSFCPNRPRSQIIASVTPIMPMLVAGQTSAECDNGHTASPCASLSSFILQPATCASLPSVRICARPNTLSVVTHICWRAPSLPSCPLSIWPPGCLCPAPGSAPTHWQEKRSELAPWPQYHANGPTIQSLRP